VTFLESAEIMGDEIMGELGAKTQNLLFVFLLILILERFYIFWPYFYAQITATVIV